MAGDYLCQVTDGENNKVNRTIHVYVHGMLIYCFISQYILTHYVNNDNIVFILQIKSVHILLQSSMATQ